MRETYTQLYLHVVSATWDRQPILTEEIRGTVYSCIAGDCCKVGAEVIAIGGTCDHVHVLVRLPTTLSVADLVKQIKGSSSHLTNRVLEGHGGFKWQGGHAAFTVSKSAAAAVRSYILNQETHHRDGTTDRNMEVAWEDEEAHPGA